MRTMSARRIAGAAGMLGTLFALIGCGSVGSPLEAISQKVPPPDEFQVIAHKPLQMPASTELPEPRPGAPSPLDPNPQGEAMAALLGTTGSPVATGTAPSAGEQVLLSSANAAATSSEIRVQLEEDKITEQANKPYTPPTVAALLGMSGGSEELDEKELIDPLAESQRLQREGVAAPVDPNAAAAETEQAPRDSAGPAYPAGRPKNKIVHPGTGPTY